MKYVVGAGPAGLTAAYLLASRGHDVTVMEKASGPGGLWRGTTEQAHHFETGMHWYTECGIDEIDRFWRDLPVDHHPIPREIAGCWFGDHLQTNSPYPDLRPSANPPPGIAQPDILKSLWDVDDADILADHADKLIKVDRCVIMDEIWTLEAYEFEPDKAPGLLAWPDQRTLPEKYRSEQTSFYPKDGMVALADAAVVKLKSMGVAFDFDTDGILPSNADVIWTAGLRGAARTYGIPWPDLEHEPLRVTVANCLGDAPDHDLHYAFDYTDRSLFRVTWYCNFTGDPNDRRISYEYIDPPGMDLMPDGLQRLGTHDLGPILPVPTIANEKALDRVRLALADLTPVTLLGSGAEQGLFYQPEIFRHIYERLN